MWRGSISSSRARRANCLLNLAPLPPLQFSHIPTFSPARSSLLFSCRMDPISGITGVIGLSKAFIDVISGLKSLRSKYRNAPTALKDIYNECTISQTVLSRVQYILQRHSAALKSTSDARGDLITCFDTAVSETRAVLEDFQCQIEKFRGRNDSKIATGFRARAEIVWKDSYLKETLRRIRDLRANVDFTISSLQLSVPSHTVTAASCTGLTITVTRYMPCMNKSPRRTRSLRLCQSARYPRNQLVLTMSAYMHI